MKISEHLALSEVIRSETAKRHGISNMPTPEHIESQHCSGEAIDVDMDGSTNGVTNKMVFDYIKDNLEFDQLIWEFGTSENPDWVHVSYESTGKQRKQILKASRVNGKTQYSPYK